MSCCGSDKLGMRMAIPNNASTGRCGVLHSVTEINEDDGVNGRPEMSNVEIHWRVFLQSAQSAPLLLRRS